MLTGPDCSIAILTKQRVLVVPPDDTGLAGMAARNIAELALQVGGLAGGAIWQSTALLRLWSAFGCCVVHASHW